MSAARRIANPRATLPRSARGRVLTTATGALAAALMVGGCTSGGVSGGSDKSGYVTNSGGVSVVKKADRKPGPKLDGTTLDGKKLDVASYRGKVVVLNTWGSWCPPCREEARGFAKVAEATADQGVQFVGINTRDHDKGPAQQFEKSYKVPYPSLYDPAGRLMLRFPKGTLNPQSIPSTVVLDRDGDLAARSLAPLSEEKLRKMLDPLIAEK
ncbi:TlpA family protein disulfide reductase [Streptomyces sp. NPDC050560]|uniref:TlpA family protein disulfide reductase n=1 Tax=Streptomyces sp. NPDC050560 TaxID=3365630 RepID=UPI0037BD5FC7